MGDSISALSGYIPVGYKPFYPREGTEGERIKRPSQIWWGKVIDALGGKLLVNGSWSGSLVSLHPDCEVPSYGCSDERVKMLDKPDVVMIFMGMNDAGWEMKISPFDLSEQSDISIFSVAYGTMLDKIKALCPDTEIWCISLPHAPEYSKVVELSAKAHGAKFIEIAPYSTFDGLHPNELGMTQIADSIIDYITHNP